MSVVQARVTLFENWTNVLSSVGIILTTGTVEQRTLLLERCISEKWLAVLLQNTSWRLEFTQLVCRLLGLSWHPTLGASFVCTTECG